MISSTLGLALKISTTTSTPNGLKYSPAQQSPRNQVDRAGFLFSLSSVVALTTASPAFAAAEPPKTGIQRNGRLAACPNQGNCLSTSSIRSLDKFSSPWTFENTGDSIDEAWSKLVKIIKEDPLLKLEELDNEKFYLRATAKSAIPPTGLDDLEFLLRPEDKIATYRTASREAVYVGPVLLGDGGANQNRLDKLRYQLKWDVVGAGPVEQQKGLDRLKGSTSVDFIKYD